MERNKESTGWDVLTILYKSIFTTPRDYSQLITVAHIGSSFILTKARCCPPSVMGKSICLTTLEMKQNQLFFSILLTINQLDYIRITCY